MLRLSTALASWELVDAHLSPDDMAGMADGRLLAERRVAVETHLAVCRQCRNELASITSLVDSAAPLVRKRSRWPIAGVGLVAAAAALLFVIPRRQAPRQSDATDLRGSGMAGSVTVVRPTSASIDQDSVQFVWRHDDGSTYRLVVTDSAGAQIFTTSTSDTAVAPAARFEPGARYFWYVDALRPDGSSVSSPSTSFSIRRR